jgi:Zn-dependent protease with chaperone function
MKRLAYILLLVIINVTSPAWAGITTEQRVSLSEKMMGEITRSHGKPQSLDSESKVHQIFNTLVQHASRKEIKYRVSVIRNSQVNAFAMPDGRVVFLSGLLDALPGDNDGPIAYVAGHEISHIELRHGEKKFQQAMTTGILISLLTRGSGDWVRLLGGVGHGLLTSGYSREKEYEADRGALELMKKAGYDPNGAMVMLTIFQSMAGRGARIFPTHPRAEDRMKSAMTWMQEQGIAVSTSAPRVQVSIPAAGVTKKEEPPQAQAPPQPLSTTAANPAGTADSASPPPAALSPAPMENKVPPAGPVSLKDRRGNKYRLSTYTGKRPTLIYYWSNPYHRTADDFHALAMLNRELSLQPVAIQISARHRKAAHHMLLTTLATVRDYPLFFDMSGDFKKAYTPEGECGMILLDRRGYEVRRWNGSPLERQITTELKVALNDMRTSYTSLP